MSVFDTVTVPTPPAPSPEYVKALATVQLQGLKPHYDQAKADLAATPAPSPDELAKAAEHLTTAQNTHPGPHSDEKAIADIAAKVGEAQAAVNALEDQQRRHDDLVKRVADLEAAGADLAMQAGL